MHCIKQKTRNTIIKLMIMKPKLISRAIIISKELFKESRVIGD